MKIGLKEKVLFVIAIPLAFELAFIAVLGLWLDAAYRQNDRVQHCRAIVTASHDIGQSFYEATRYLAFYSIKHDEESRRKIYEAIDAIPVKFREMKELAKHNPRELAVIKEADKTARDLVEQFKAIGTKVDEEDFAISDFAVARQSRVKMQETLDALVAQLKEINNREAIAQKATPEDIERTRLAITELLIAGIVINTAIALISAVVFSKGILDKIDVLSKNAERFAAQEPLLEPLSGRDELSQLDDVFHQMTRKLAELERHERAMIDNAVDVICTLNDKAEFTAVSPSSQALLGYQSDELKGEKLDAVLVEDESDKFVQRLKTAQSTGLESSLRRKDGSLVDVLWSAQWVEKEGEIFCTIHDISEKKRVERLKRELIAMVSHDLRSPLSSIRALFELLSSHAYGPINDKGIKRIAGLDQEALRLIQLINDLLDLEKMEAGKLEMKKSLSSTDTIAGRALESLKDLAERQSLTLGQDVESLDVLVDSERIVQVIVNFLSNAIKFSPADKEIWLRVFREGENVRWIVADEAGGLPEGMDQKVFQRFEQSREEHAKFGSGLGLSISQTIVELHGGTIGVNNKPGVGCEFWFLIPIEKAGSDS